MSAEEAQILNELWLEQLTQLYIAIADDLGPLEEYQRVRWCEYLTDCAQYFKLSEIKPWSSPRILRAALHEASYDIRSAAPAFGIDISITELRRLTYLAVISNPLYLLNSQKELKQLATFALARLVCM